MECVAVLPKEHALCAHEIITPKLMSGLPFVGMSREWAAHHLVNSVFAEAAAHLNVVVASELFAMIWELVANGVGVSIVAPASPRQLQAPALAILPLLRLSPYDIAL